jgi:hypothetical protein
MHAAIMGRLEEILTDLWKQVALPTLAFIIINDYEEEHVENKVTMKE